MLLQAYRDYCKVVVPFADPALVNLFLSAPYCLRKDKLIIRKLMLVRNSKVANLTDLSTAISKQTPQLLLRAKLRKWSSRISLILRLLTNDKIKYFNPYWTEDLIGAYRVECRKPILTSLNALYHQGVLSTQQLLVLKPKPIRSYEVARIGTILSYFPAFVEKSKHYTQEIKLFEK